jgi:predicted dehydrogenase
MNEIDDYRTGVAVTQPLLPDAPNRTTRRHFLTSATKAVVVGSLAALDISRFAHAAGSGVIRLGLVGCGGRGTGAARQALATGKDVKLVAMADVQGEKITGSLDQLKKTPVAGQLEVTGERRFSGFDAFQNLLAAGVDGVLLTTPPGFRPLHFEAAIRAGVHCFLEKPVAVDAPGVRRVRAAAEGARQKGCSVIVGLQEHFEKSYEQFMSEISNGAIGTTKRLSAIIRRTDVPRWAQRATLNKQLRRPLTEMEFQMRNWYPFTWLAGDMIVEMLVHRIDTCLWAIGRPPQSVQGRAERREHTSSDDGNISDFLSVKYLYADGIEMQAEISGLAGNVNTHEATIEGEKGIATAPNKIVNRQGQVIWNYSGPKIDPYQEEMNQWCASIRRGKPLNTVSSAADSTLVAIMGRTAAYTGREVTWAEIQRSTETFFPANPKSFEDFPAALPDKFGDYQFPSRGLPNGAP